MVNMGPVGGKFISQRPCHGGWLVSKRLDRAIASLDWRLCFSNGYVEHLYHLYSNHNLILLRCGSSIL